MPTHETPYDLLLAELSRDGARPFVTFYDDATSERVELSVKSFDNWVAKTAGLLQNGLSVEAGESVSIELPAHWQSLVCVCACWAVGASVQAEPDETTVASFVGPDVAEPAPHATVNVLALALRPMGGRFTEPLPNGVADYAAEVPGYPDQLVPYIPPSPDESALADNWPGGGQALGEVVEAARTRAEALDRGARIYLPVDDLPTAVMDALLVPLVVAGSVVLVRHEDPAKRDGKLNTERARLLGA